MLLQKKRNKPTNKEFAEIFDSAAVGFGDTINPYTTKRRNDFFLKWAHGTCLEIGAGSGRLASLLLSRGMSVVATDISPRLVAEMKKKKINAIVCDAEKLPFPDGAFDTVIAAELIYYLDHPESFVSEVQRVLKPGGVFLISAANNTAKLYDRIRAFLRYFGFQYTYFDDGVREFMTTLRLKNYLAQNGFVLKEHHKVVLLPFSLCHAINRIFERTALKHLAVFILIRATKRQS